MKSRHWGMALLGGALALAWCARAQSHAWTFGEPAAVAAITEYRHCTAVQEGDALCLATTGPDSGIVLGGLSLDPRRCQAIRLTVRYSGFRSDFISGQVYFTTERSPKFDDRHYFQFRLPNVEREQVVTLRPAQAKAAPANWLEEGRITGLRFDFADQHPGTIRVRRIEALSAGGAGPVVHDFTQPRPEWRDSFALTQTRQPDGLRLDVTGPDCRIVNRSIDLPTDKYRRIRITYSATGFAQGISNGEIFYTTTEHPTIDAGRYFVIPALKTDGKEHRLDISTPWHYPGNLKLLRLDLTNSAGGVILLKKIEFLEGAAGAAPPAASAIPLPRGWPPRVVPELPPPPHRENMAPGKYFTGRLCFFPGQAKATGSCFLRHTFAVDFEPRQAWLQIVADDRVEEVFLNGRRLEHPWSPDWKVPNLVQIPDGLLKRGDNLLAVKYLNTGDVGGALYDLSIRGAQKSFLRVASGAGTMASRTAAPDWFRPEAAAGDGWTAAGTCDPPPAAPWMVRLAYRDFEPDDARGAILDGEARTSVEDGVLAMRGRVVAAPRIGAADAIRVTIANHRGRVVSRRSYPAAAFHFRQDGDGASFDFADFDLTRYGAALRGRITLEFLGREMRRELAAEFALPSRPLPGADRPVAAECRQTEGGPVLLLDGRLVYPTFLTNFTYHENLADADETGLGGADSPVVIREFSANPRTVPWWVGDDEYDFEKVDRQFQFILRHFPNARIGVWLWCQPGEWYARRYPERLSRNSRGEIFSYYTAPVTFSGRAYLEDVRRAVAAFVEYAERHYGNKVAVYNLCGGVSCEWQGWDCHWTHQKRSLHDYSQTAQEDFRAYAMRLHGVAPAMPSMEERLGAEGELFRDPVKECAAILYDEYYSASVAECIRHCARAVRTALRGRRKLIGAYYGYVFEYAQYNWCVNAAGHNAVQAILDDDGIDFLLSPNSYYNRAVGETNGDMKPFASLRAHGKFSILEDDTRTHLAPWDGNALMGQTLDEAQTTAVLRRNWGMALSRRMPVCNLPLRTGGDLCSPRIRRDLQITREMGQRLFEKPGKSGVETAFVLDEDALKYLTPQTAHPQEPGFRYLYDNPQGVLHAHPRKAQILSGTLITENRDRLARTGAPFDQLLLGDVPRLARQYKLWIITAAFADSRRLREALAALRQEQVTILVPFGAGFISAGKRIDAAAMSSLLGMKMALLSAGSAEVQVGGRSMGAASPLPQRFAVMEERATVLGRYKDGGAVAVASVPYGKATLVFCGCPLLAPEFTAEILRQAGGHLYTAPGDVLYAGYGIVTLHAASPGDKRIVFPAPMELWDVYEQKRLAAGVREWTIPMHALETRVLHAIPMPGR